jgi:hypothetical protein
MLHQTEGQPLQAVNKVLYVVIPNEVRNPSGFEIQKKEGFLARRSGFGMTTFLFI